MRADYRVQSWTVDSGFDPTELRERYVAEGSDGVYLRAERGTGLDSVEFLADFPNLKYVEISGTVKDDTASFLLPALEELILLTRCQVPIPALTGSAVLRVGVDDRPGKEALADISGLRELSVWSWDGPDLVFLGRQPQLSRLTVEGMRSVYSLQGLELCEALVEVELKEMGVQSLAPLRGLRKLRRLWLLGSPRTHGSPRVLDLADLAGSNDLEELRLTYGGSVGSVRPLAALNNLRDVRLRGTTVLDADLAPLTDLADRAVVVGPND
jgi:hypothetical protein